MDYFNRKNFEPVRVENSAPDLLRIRYGNQVWSLGRIKPEETEKLKKNFVIRDNKEATPEMRLRRQIKAGDFPFSPGLFPRSILLAMVGTMSAAALRMVLTAALSGLSDKWRERLGLKPMPDKDKKKKEEERQEAERIHEILAPAIGFGFLPSFAEMAMIVGVYALALEQRLQQRIIQVVAPVGLMMQHGWQKLSVAYNRIRTKVLGRRSLRADAKLGPSMAVVMPAPQPQNIPVPIAM